MIDADVRAVAASGDTPLRRNMASARELAASGLLIPFAGLSVCVFNRAVVSAHDSSLVALQQGVAHAQASGGAANDVYLFTVPPHV